LRHHALALRLHWSRNQTVLLCLSRGIPGARERKDPNMATAFSLFGGLCARDLIEIHRDRLGPGSRLPDLCTVSWRLAFTMERGTERLCQRHRDLGVERYRMASVLEPKGRRGSRLHRMDGRFSTPVLYERNRPFRLSE